MVKSLSFKSMNAYNVWLTNNKPFVHVISISEPNSEFGYEVSARLPHPEITISYIEFTREDL